MSHSVTVTTIVPSSAASTSDCQVPAVEPIQAGVHAMAATKTTHRAMAAHPTRRNPRASRGRYQRAHRRGRREGPAASRSTLNCSPSR